VPYSRPTGSLLGPPRKGYQEIQRLACGFALRAERALEGIRTPNLLIRSYSARCVVQTSKDAGRLRARCLELDGVSGAGFGRYIGSDGSSTRNNSAVRAGMLVIGGTSHSSLPSSA
jgi:hypothetical protein